MTAPFSALPLTEIRVTQIQHRANGRAWLNPPEVAGELSRYVAENGRLPDEWLAWIEIERKEAEDGARESYQGD